MPPEEAKKALPKRQRNARNTPSDSRLTSVVVVGVICAYSKNKGVLKNGIFVPALPPFLFQPATRLWLSLPDWHHLPSPPIFCHLT